MNIKTKEEFLNASFLERKFYLATKGMTQQSLVRRFKKNASTTNISYALQGKNKTLLNRIANSLFKEQPSANLN